MDLILEHVRTTNNNNNNQDLETRVLSTIRTFTYNRGIFTGSTSSQKRLSNEELIKSIKEDEVGRFVQEDELCEGCQELTLSSCTFATCVICSILFSYYHLNFPLLVDFKVYPGKWFEESKMEIEEVEDDDNESNNNNSDNENDDDNKSDPEYKETDDDDDEENEEKLNEEEVQATMEYFNSLVRTRADARRLRSISIDLNEGDDNNGLRRSERLRRRLN
jgi:hypothetical protein